MWLYHVDVPAPEIKDRLETDLYFESHITVEPVFDERLEELKKIAAKYEFRIAELLMKKRASDSEFRSRYDTFCTGNSKDYKQLEHRMYAFEDEAQAKGFQIWRHKIENTLLDERFPHATSN